MQCERGRGSWALFTWYSDVSPKRFEERERGWHVLHSTVAKSEHVKCKVSVMGIVGRCFQFDGGFLPKRSEQWERGRQVFHSTVVTSGHMKYKEGMIGVVGRCLHGIV